MGGWPIDASNSGVRYRTTADGEVFANGARVTERRGWIELAMPDELLARGAPPWIELRLGFAPGAARTGMGAAPRLLVTELRAGTDHVAGAAAVRAFVTSLGPAAVARALHDEIARRIDERRGPRPAADSERPVSGQYAKISRSASAPPPPANVAGERDATAGRASPRRGGSR